MKIIICGSCSGEGLKSEYDDRNDYEVVTCRRCNGTGRLKQLTCTITFPFDNHINDVYQASKELVDLRRKYEK